MFHEKDFKKQNGDTVKVVVSFYTELNYNKVHWKVECHLRPAGKRNFNNIPKEKLSQYITTPEVLEVKLELWKLLKPTI